MPLKSGWMIQNDFSHCVGMHCSSRLYSSQKSGSFGTAITTAFSTNSLSLKQAKNFKDEFKMADTPKAEDLHAEGEAELKEKVDVASQMLQAFNEKKDLFLKFAGGEKQKATEQLAVMQTKTAEFKKRIEVASGDKEEMAKLQEEWKTWANQMFNQGLTDLYAAWADIEKKLPEGLKEFGKSIGLKK